MKMKGKPAAGTETEESFSEPSSWFRLCMYSVAASIALKADWRVMVSYVDSESGIDAEPDTNRLKFPNPDASSNKSPMQ